MFWPLVWFGFFYDQCGQQESCNRLIHQMFNQLTYDRISVLEGPPLAWPARVSTDPPIIVSPGLQSPLPQKPPASPGERREEGGSQADPC